MNSKPRSAASPICASCSDPFPRFGRMLFCFPCSKIINRSIRRMVAEGFNSNEITTRLDLTLKNFRNRLRLIRENDLAAGRPLLVLQHSPRGPDKLGPVLPPKPAAVKRKCRWPSGPGREMHACCRPASGLACDGDDEDDDAHVGNMTPVSFNVHKSEGEYARSHRG